MFSDSPEKALYYYVHQFSAFSAPSPDLQGYSKSLQLTFYSKAVIAKLQTL